MGTDLPSFHVRFQGVWPIFSWPTDIAGTETVLWPLWASSISVAGNRHSKIAANFAGLPIRVNLP